MRDTLGDIPLERQRHPSLSRAAPFELLHDFHPRRNSRFAGDVHRALQLTVVMAGRAEAAFHDGAHRYGAGECWWTDAYEPHACRPLADGTFLLSVNLLPESLGECGPFAAADFRALFQGAPAERYRPPTARARARTRLLFGRWFGLYRRRPAEWRARVWLGLHAWMLEALAARRAPADDAVAEARERVRPALERLRRAGEGAEPAPTLAAAAAACALSVGRFSVHFRRATGATYGQYALRERLAAGARDVATGRYALKEIARRHGFCDAAGFCNAFRRVYRCRPSEFRRTKLEPPASPRSGKRG